MIDIAQSEVNVESISPPSIICWPFGSWDKKRRKKKKMFIPFADIESGI